MPLPRQRRGETTAFALTSRPASKAPRPRNPGPLLMVGAGLLLMALAVFESARAAPPPPLPPEAQRLTGAELRVLTAHAASYRNRDTADPTTYTLRPDGIVTIHMKRDRQAVDGRWRIEADRLCIRIGFFYRSCSAAWRLDEDSFFFWGDDEDARSGLLRNTYDRLR